MTIIIHHITSIDNKRFTKHRLEVQPPVKLSCLLSCVPAIEPYSTVKDDLVPCILETGDEIDDNHPWIQAWEPVASLKWGFNIVWLPKGEEIPKKGTVAAEWKLEWRFPNAEIAIRCMLLELGVTPGTAREISRCIVEFIPSGDNTMPLTTKRAKFVYLAMNSAEALNRKAGYMTNDWTTDEIYNVLLEEIRERSSHPEPSSIGIQSTNLGAKHGPVIWAAQMEIDRIFQNIYSYHSEEVIKVPNPYFCINFTHQGKRDSFPLFNWMDPNITALCSLIEIAAESVNMPLTEENIARLNVIVRQYREGDKIGWHTDWKGYSENVGGLIIENKDPSRGLCFFRNGRPPIMLYEETGVVFRVSGEVRWKWMHGFSARKAVEGNAPRHLRTSVTFRFFSKLGKHLTSNCQKEPVQKWLDTPAPTSEVYGPELETHDNWNSQYYGLGDIWENQCGPGNWGSQQCTPGDNWETHEYGPVAVKQPEWMDRSVMSQKRLGHAGHCYAQRNTIIQDFERKIKSKTPPKAARPTDMNSYNLMKILGLNAVKPACDDDLIFDENGQSIYSKNVREDIKWGMG